MLFLERALPSRRPFGVNMRHSPGSTSQEDALTEVLQAGAHKLLTQAVEAEVASFLEACAALVDGAGRPPGYAQWISAGTRHPDRDR